MNNTSGQELLLPGRFALTLTDEVKRPCAYAKPLLVLNL